jgi:mycothiol synthase
MNARPSPPPGYAVRAPVPGDAEAVATLKRAADAGRRESDVTAASVREEWTLPRLRLDEDAWLVLSADGRPAAYGFVFLDEPPEVFVTSHTLHPDHRGSGLEEYLLAVSEARVTALAAAARPPVTAVLQVFAYEGDAERLDLYRARGYAHVRTFVRLQVSLEEAPATPRWPPGVAVHGFRRGCDEAALHAALQEVFLDHWRPTVMDLDEWRACHFAEPDVDLGLWWLAWDGHEVAGALIASATPLGGYVDEVAVRRPWRRRGLARALMLQAFAELRRRGHATAYLGVDTRNPTGALPLYESLGMRQAGEAHLVLERRLPRPRALALRVPPLASSDANG